MAPPDPDRDSIPLSDLSTAAIDTRAQAVIRFTNGQADLVVPLPSPNTSRVASLLASIRHDRTTTARRRLRLIHAGKVLSPAALISTVYRPRSRTSHRDSKGKGKGKADSTVDADVYAYADGDDADADDDGRVWIHCSVGDELTDAELAAEATAEPLTQPVQSTLPQPQGFDRLLSAGFSAAEVAALRSQFNRLNPHVNAEDMRMVEERWIDESAGAGAGMGGGGGGASDDGGYEDMWIGTIIGFFWPPSVLLLREEGICSKRRMMAIVGGVLVNILFGLIRMSA